MAQKVKVFISSSTDEKDIAVVGKLDKFLGGLKNSGIIEVRTSQEITAGSDLEKETKRELQNADLILLIISIDYITSSKIWKKELEIAMGRHERMEARVIPIFARSTPLLDILQFSKLKDLPGDKKTISDFARSKPWL